MQGGAKKNIGVRNKMSKIGYKDRPCRNNDAIGMYFDRVSEGKIEKRIQRIQQCHWYFEMHFSKDETCYETL